MAQSILKQIGQEFGELAKKAGEEVNKNLKEGAKEAVSSITGMEVKDRSEKSPQELEQLKKIGLEKEKQKNKEFPELRRILKQQELDKQALDQERQMKQQLSAQTAQHILVEKQNKMRPMQNPLDSVGSKITGIKALFKNKKENKQQ